ncbi:hypothetical protein R6Q57_013394 [Mikania cordata]
MFLIRVEDLVAEQPVAVEEENDPEVQQAAEQPSAEIEQRADPPKRRGPNINQSVARTLHNLPEGTKIPLTMDKETKTFVGTSATKFATECGIVIRNGSFELLRADNVFMEYVDARLCAQWKRTRGVLSQHWKKNEGKTNPLVTRSNMKPDCRSEEDWNHLCNYWELEKTQENIIEHKKAAVNELTLKVTVITTAIEHNLEKEAIQSVCGKQKTLQSAWEVGVGQVLRKKDSWMKTSVQSSHQDSSHTNEDLENQVIALKKKLEDSNEKYQRMSKFINTKFPEFENIISTPVTDEAHDSEGLFGDSYHTT